MRSTQTLLLVGVIGVLSAAAPVLARIEPRNPHYAESAADPGSCSLAEEKVFLSKLKASELQRQRAYALDLSLDRDKRGFAILNISLLGTAEAALFLNEVWDNPLNVLDHEKLCLIDWSAEHCGTNCVPMLLKGLRQAWSDERWHAARALAMIQGDNVLPVLERLAADDSDGIVRSQTAEFIGNITRQRADRKEEVEKAAVISAIVAWGVSTNSDRYIKGEVIYLIRAGIPDSVQSEVLRLYPMPDLDMLRKAGSAFAISEVTLANHEASARLSYAQSPPIDPVPFPFSGWRLKLGKTGLKWSVTEAQRVEPGK